MRKNSIDVFPRLLLLLISLNISPSNAQQADDKLYKALKVGDTMPAYKLSNMINYPQQAAYVSAFKGKLLIFDLWSTHCASCVESWPKLLELQKKFDGKIQIILLNPDQGYDKVKEVFQRRKRAGINMTLPAICKDSLLGNVLFSHTGVPHCVWIDQEGKVISITYGEEINSKNIEAVLAGDKIEMHQKPVKQTDLHISKSLFADPSKLQHLIFQSSISEYIDGEMPMTYELMADEKRGYYIYIAQPLQTVYGFAFSDRIDTFTNHSVMRLLDNRILLNVKDSSRYVRIVGGTTNWQSFYAYQLITKKPSTTQELQSIMQTDLNRYFNTTVHWKKCKRKCLVLRMENPDHVSYKGGNRFEKISDIEFKLNKVSINRFIYFLEQFTDYFSSPYPIINETGYKGLIGPLELIGNINDYTVLDKLLHKYKMSIKLEEREIDMLVIEDLIINVK